MILMFECIKDKDSNDIRPVLDCHLTIRCFDAKKELKSGASNSSAEKNAKCLLLFYIM